MAALSLETIGAGKSFGAFRALEDVSIKIRHGSVHALLGENGAGKSTLVKGIIGYSQLDQGSILLDGREQSITSPRVAHALGIGMVYQHFTLAPGLTVAENLLLARGRLPWHIAWSRVEAELEAFMAAMPFRLALGSLVCTLSAGEKQKLELLKQLYLKRRFLILDEPTSVLTPQEAQEVLGLVRDLAQQQQLTVLMITHKFQEVFSFADEVSVLRKGQLVAHAHVAHTSPGELASAMMGSARISLQPRHRTPTSAAHQSLSAQAPPGLDVARLCVASDRGTMAVNHLSLQVRRGEIVGLAGISGNGQKELVEVLLGQRHALSGKIAVNGMPYTATRSQMEQQKVFSLPEEPLHNACIGSMTIAENLALRQFHTPAMRKPGWRIKRSAMKTQAQTLIAAFNVKPAAPERLINTLSGGNVQRAVLARELSQAATLLIAANPVFGLDFAAVSDIHARILAARDQGSAVLLVSEDLDELLELADRIMVISDGCIVHMADGPEFERAALGSHMAGAAKETA